MTTHPPPANLWSAIEQAVGTALQELGVSATWNRYRGVKLEQLESELKNVLGVAHCGLVCSGSVALELLLRGCGIQAGDEVLLSGYDYPGTFAAVEHVQARPVLVDVVPRSWALDLEQLEAAYTPACRALVVSHLHGQVQPLEPLQAWCRARGVLLIQDLCQAIGARHGVEPLSAFGDALFISFGGGKTLSAGRGGAWLTNQAALAQQARIAEGPGSGCYSLSQLQAAVVLAQLPFLESITVRCRAYFAAVAEELQRASNHWSVPWWPERSSTAFYQAGWVRGAAVPGSAESEPAVDERGMADALGTGFPGFHRRSARRCRLVGPLLHTAEVASQTLTVHQRIALEGLVPPSDLVQALLRRERNSQPPPA
jgi:perosamine synthetase